MFAAGKPPATGFQGVGVNPGRVIAPVKHMPEPLAEPVTGEILPPGVDPTEVIADLKAAALAVHDELQERATRASKDGKAALPALAVILTGLGVNTLSLTGRSLAAVGTVLKSVTLAEVQELAALAVDAATSATGREAVRARLPVLAELGL